MGTAMGKKKCKLILEYERLYELAAAEAATLTKDTIHTPPPPLPPLEAALGAGAIQAYGGAAHLHSALGDLFGRRVEVDSYRVYLDGLTAGYADPIDRLLAEQLVIVHLASGRLAGLAASATGASQSAVLAAGAARLVAECRRHAVVLRDRRAVAKTAAIPVAVNTELVSKTETSERAKHGEKPKASRRGEAQPSQAGLLVGCGSGAVAGSRASRQAVAVVNGTTDSGRQSKRDGQRQSPASRLPVGPADPPALGRAQRSRGGDGRGSGGGQSPGRKALVESKPTRHRKRRAVAVTA